MGRIIGDNRGLVIKQRVSAAEAITGGCCEIENVYVETTLRRYCYYYYYYYYYQRIYYAPGGY